MSDLNLYEEQLKQIQAAQANCTNEEDLKNLQSLEKDLKDLINLSFLESLENEDTDKNEPESDIEATNNQQVSLFASYSQNFSLPQRNSFRTCTKIFLIKSAVLLSVYMEIPSFTMHLSRKLSMKIARETF
jgi:hypothetical protein